MLGSLLVTLMAATAPAPLPVVAVEAERRIGGSKVPAHLRAPGFDGQIAIGVRGRWSRRFPKRSFALELRDRDGGNRNAPLLGMPADDDWILYAAYNVLAGWMLAQRPWAERLYADRAFGRAVARRWRALRRAGLRARLLRQVRAHERRLSPDARRDSRRWPAGGHRPRGRREQHVAELRRWLEARIGWLDANVGRLG